MYLRKLSIPSFPNHALIPGWKGILIVAAVGVILNIPLILNYFFGIL